MCTDRQSYVYIRYNRAFAPLSLFSPILFQPDSYAQQSIEVHTASMCAIIPMFLILLLKALISLSGFAGS